MDTLLRVNLTVGSVKREPVPQPYKYLGGRGLTSRVVADEVPPHCDPLGPQNKLVLAPGLISGTTVSSTNRLSVGCKSPLTGGIKEANAGGETGLYLAQAGYRGVIVEGARPDGDWVVLVIGPGTEARLEPAGEVVGLGAYESADHLFERFGRKAAISLIGPAGEMRMNIAGVANTDKEGRPSRIAARGGVGAVMGAKGLKAMVVLGDARHPVPAADPTAWKEGMGGVHKTMQAMTHVMDRISNYGTAATLELVNKLGGLPTRNFSSGRFEKADEISGENMREIILARGGEGATTHACMTGCAVRCSNVFANKEGREVVSSLEYETNALLGSNLALADFDSIARLTWICNDLGCDTIETGGALGVLMKAGVLAFGDGAAAELLLDKDVRSGTPLGRVLGSGAGHAGRTYGVREVPVVKNQSMPAYDPRVIKGNGVTYVTSAMGADHTAGFTFAARTDHLDPSDKVELSRTAQVTTAVVDSLGLCLLAMWLYGASPEAFVSLVKGRFGEDVTVDQLNELARDVLRREMAFNRAAGLGPATDRLPEWMQETPLPPHNARFDVPREQIDRLIGEISEPAQA